MLLEKNDPVLTKRHCCRVCDGTQLERFLSLGHTPLANSFLASSDEFGDEASYPLDVYFCKECSCAQILDVIAPDTLFSNYVYVSGTSDTIGAHYQSYASSLVDALDLASDDLVIEVASNDGSLLRCFQERGVKTLGVEPATNIAQLASQAGVNTIKRFFNSQTAIEIRKLHGRAKAVVGNNVLAHVDETQDFLRGCGMLLDDGGLTVIEVPYVRELVTRLAYDTIYHEHLCYFSVTALLRLCDRVGLSIIRIDRVPVHGGSLRMYAGRRKDYPDHANEILAMAAEEKRIGLTELPFYQRFSAEVARHRETLVAMLERLTTDGRTVAGYGAPAKGNTLLNYCGIDRQLLPYTVDKNPFKVGWYTPGMHIPVLPVSTLAERAPDYLLVLAWNFVEEIIRQQREYREKGGQFIVPIPQPRVV